MTALYRHRVEVRFADCDPLGHTNNAVYLSFLEQARFGLWRALWGFDGATVTTAARGAGVILARTEIDFRAQTTFGDVLEVTVGLAGTGRTSFTYEYEIRDTRSGALVASAKSVQVLFDFATNTPVAIGDEIRGDLARVIPG